MRYTINASATFPRRRFMGALYDAPMVALAVVEVPDGHPAYAKGETPALSISQTPRGRFVLHIAAPGPCGLIRSEIRERGCHALAHGIVVDEPAPAAEDRFTNDTIHLDAEKVAALRSRTDALVREAFAGMSVPSTVLDGTAHAFHRFGADTPPAVPTPMNWTRWTEGSAYADLLKPGEGFAMSLAARSLWELESVEYPPSAPPIWMGVDLATGGDAQATFTGEGGRKVFGVHKGVPIYDRDVWAELSRVDRHSADVIHLYQPGSTVPLCAGETSPPSEQTSVLHDLLYLAERLEAAAMQLAFHGGPAVNSLENDAHVAALGLALVRTKLDAIHSAAQDSVASIAAATLLVDDAQKLTTWPVPQETYLRFMAGLRTHLINARHNARRAKLRDNPMWAPRVVQR